MNYIFANGKDWFATPLKMARKDDNGRFPTTAFGNDRLKGHNFEREFVKYCKRQ